jgi:hypothetical protein
MRLEPVVRKVLPPELPASATEEDEVTLTAESERFVWESLVPRLVHPLKLAIIEALLRTGLPLSPVDLAAMLDSSDEFILYHCKYLANVGIIEVGEFEPIRVEGKFSSDGGSSAYVLAGICSNGR